MLRRGKIPIEDAGVVIDSGFDEAQLLASSLYEHVIEVRNFQSGSAYSIGSRRIVGRDFYLWLAFTGGILTDVRLTADERGSNSFEEFDIRTLRKEKRDIDRWLRSVAGVCEETSFVWGSIASFYDERSFSVGIVIHFATESEIRDRVGLGISAFCERLHCSMHFGYLGAIWWVVTVAMCIVEWRLDILIGSGLGFWLFGYLLTVVSYIVRRM
jgi:hypothetical protein